MKKLLGLLLALLLLISGCAPVASSAEKDEKITITDQIGREVTLSAVPKKIVSSYYISTSLLIALGAEDKLVGIEAKADTREIYKKAAPQLLDLPAVGTGKGINVEEIAKLAPDLVVLPVKLKDSVALLEKLNIPTLVIDPETMESFQKTITLLGIAIGAVERSASLLDYYEKSFSAITKQTTAVETRPKVYLAGTGNVFTTISSKMYQHELIAAAGGENVSKNLENGYWQSISPEELLAYAPDQLLLVGYCGYTIDSVVSDAKLKTLSAVQSGNVAYFPSALEPWDYPTPSSVLGLLWLTNRLHPQLYTQETYLKEATDFYKTYFDIEITPEDIGL